MFAHDATRGLDAITSGHSQVHEHDIAVALTNQTDRLFAVDRRAHDLDARAQSQQHFQALANQRLVVRDQDAD